MFIGARKGWSGHPDPTRPFDGLIDDIRIYDRALSEDEIELLYRAESPNHFVDSAKDLEMIWVEPGTFTMGQNDISDASPEHNVTLTNGFYLGKYEVTQAQYEAVMSGNTDGLSPTPSAYGGNPNRPVEKVSWEDIQKFLTRLNDQETGNIPSGWAYVLPTEAQWEYACRAGTTTAYYWGDTINASDANWNHGSDANQTENVGQYNANPWGFFDMHGNVWEWTADAWGTYSSGAQTDPFNVGATGSNRVRRGGSWYSAGTGLRSAIRYAPGPSYRTADMGFRVGFQQVPDTVSPELELFGVTDVPHELGEPWAEPGYGASDERDGNLTNSVTISGTLDVNTSGTYTITYTVADAAGNEANTTRTVTVIDSGTDTDGDGFDDYIEAVAGSAPNDPASTPLNYGLIAWYPLDGNASDMSGNGNHGIVNGATLGKDRNGYPNQAYSFDGTDDFIELGNLLANQNRFSISAWIKSTQLDSGENLWHRNPAFVGIRQASGISNDFLFSLRAGELAWYDEFTSNTYQGIHTFIANNQWWHVVVSRDVENLAFYINSRHRKNPTTGDAGVKKAVIDLGRALWSDSIYYNGSIDEVRFYSAPCMKKRFCSFMKLKGKSILTVMVL